MAVREGIRRVVVVNGGMYGGKEGDRDQRTPQI